MDEIKVGSSVRRKSGTKWQKAAIGKVVRIFTTNRYGKISTKARVCWDRAGFARLSGNNETHTTVNVSALVLNNEAKASDE